ncbi:MAG TPA: hypothetical protein ENI87_13935 [bacterium]|nr:hypothetical protein [bacterium]
MALCALLAACGGGGGGPSSPARTGDTVLASADIGPAGGTVAVVSGLGAGIELIVPPGAVGASTRFTISTATSATIPSLFPVFRFEPAAIDFGAAPVTVTIPAGDVLFALGTPTLRMFRRERATTEWQVLSATAVDAATRTATVQATRLGEFVAWSPLLHRLFTQPGELNDPTEPVRTEFVDGVEVAVANGTIVRTLGAGSLQSFWSSSDDDNVLIVHGVLGSPLDFLGVDDLVESLRPVRSNIVLYTYPSAQGVAAAANALYDQILAHRQPGFGCSIVAHSMGGLVGRYLLERSAGDPARAGFAPGDPSLAGVVEELIMLGAPNAGSLAAVAPFETMFALLPAEERRLLQVVPDLDETPESLPLAMNAAYVDNATRYHVIFGDVGGGTDGVVTVLSTLAVPLAGDETAFGFLAAHDALHLQAAPLGIAARVLSLLDEP